MTYSGGSNGSYNIDLCNASQEAIAFHDTLGSSYNVTAGTLYYLRYRSTGSAFNLSITTSVVRLTPLDGGINSGVDRQFMDVTYNSSYTLLVPTRDGYVFAGWYDNEECEGDPYTNALGQSINNWTGLEDKDLYPKWEIE